MENKVPEEPAQQLTISPDQLKRIAGFIKSSGMSVEESCKLADFSYDVFKEIIKTNKSLENAVEKYQLEYKEALLKVVNNAAATGDKQAVWLLEHRFKEEFSTKAKKEEKGDDFIAEALKVIRSKPAPIIDETQVAQMEKTEIAARINRLINESKEA
jgi:flagellar motor component MotA